jgi:hypothetical protein
MVGAVHDEPDPGAQRAELADDQLLRPVVVEHVTGLERGRLVRVVVVGVFAHVDEIRGHQRLEQHHAWLVGKRVEHGRVRRDLRHGGHPPTSSEEAVAAVAGPSVAKPKTRRISTDTQVTCG